MKQYFFRQIDKFSDRRRWFFDELINNSQIQDKLFRYVDLNSRKKNAKECKELYLGRNYKLLNKKTILNECKVLINKVLIDKNIILLTVG